MKIALISAGNSIHTRRWATALAQRGNEVHVIFCSNHAFDFNSIQDAKVVGKKLRFPAPFGYYLNAFELRRYIKKNKFDVVNVHYASGYGTLGRLAGQKHALLNIWGSDVYEFPYQNKFNYLTIRKNLSYYKYLASTSNCMAKQTNGIIGKDRAIYITPFGVDTARFAPNTTVSKVPVRIGTVKTLNPKYGIDISIRAFAECVRMLQQAGREELVESIQYEIYGKGDEEAALRALTDELGLSDKVFFKGYVENSLLPEVLNRFTIFCCTSRQESFGVAVVEAMSCGVPCVTSDAFGLAEVMVDGETGRIVPREDVQATAAAMYALLTQDKELKNCAKQARARVEELYDWNDNVSTMLRIYEEIG